MLEPDVHDVISAFYSTKLPGQLGTVRDSLNGLTFGEQFDFGMNVVNKALTGKLP